MVNENKNNRIYEKINKIEVITFMCYFLILERINVPSAVL